MASTNKFKLSELIIHPILISISPALSLFVINRYWVQVSDFILVLGLLIVFSATFWIGLNFIIKEKRKAAFLVSIFLVLMFSFQTLLYGSNVLYVLLALPETALKFITSESYLVICLIVELLLFILVIIATVRSKWDFIPITQILNMFSIGLILFAAVSWLQLEIRQKNGQNSLLNHFESNWKGKIRNEPCIVQKTEGTRNPDIYVFILDGYGRDDVLREFYGYDNSVFITELEKRGFYIARNARSNYKHTVLTLGSMLNYDYFDDLAASTGLETLEEKNLGSMIQSNRVLHQLECLDYSFTSISTGFFYTDFPSSDTIISTGIYPSSFAYQLMDTTPLAIATLEKEYNMQRERMLDTLQKVKEIPQDGTPKFVYAHIMVGHSPFLFGSNGEAINPPREMRFNSDHQFKSLVNRADFVNGYRNQVEFISGLILESVDGILANSVEPPVIIMMGDHGPSQKFENIRERMSIFDSYYFPGKESTLLYEGITPVNSFRVLFNTYFNANLTLVPDKSDFAPPSNLYEALDVTDLIPDNVR